MCHEYYVAAAVIIDGKNTFILKGHKTNIMSVSPADLAENEIPIIETYSIRITYDPVSALPTIIKVTWFIICR